MSGLHVFPSRRIRLTPFTERVEACHVTSYTVYNHMLLPSIFVSLEDDYHHLKAHVQLWDVSAQRQVEISGPEARRLVVMLSARDLRNARPGRCYYTPITDYHGRMLNDPLILCLDENRFWLSIADSDLLLWVKALAGALGLDVQIHEPDVSPLAVQGPKATQAMERVFGAEIAKVPFFHWRPFPFKGRPLIISRSGWSKQGGFEIYLDDHSMGPELWDALWQAGQDLQIRAGGPNLIERIESGLLSYGGDITRDDTPLECGLAAYCDLDAHEFIGRNALLRQREQGITRRLVGIRLEGKGLPQLRQAWRCQYNHRDAGIVTTIIWSPDFATNLGYAMLAAHVPIHEWVEILTPIGTKRAEICALPFVKIPQ